MMTKLFIKNIKIKQLIINYNYYVMKLYLYLYIANTINK